MLGFFQPIFSPVTRSTDPFLVTRHSPESRSAQADSPFSIAQNYFLYKHQAFV
jgi:hypothetical protein